MRHHRRYSCGMISEFDLLSDKINKLVQLVQSLRQQNAELRQQIDALNADNAALAARMNEEIDALNADNAALAARMSEAHDRVAAVLDQLPAPASETEQPHDEEVA
jgi:cell division protein ZapB